MDDISEFSTTEIIEELIRRSNDRLILGMEFTSDGGENLLRFYTGQNHIVNIGLVHALRLDIENCYVQSNCQEPEDD